MSDKIDATERDRIRVETELRSEIKGLEARLNALSEQAMHAVAKEAAVEVMQRLITEGKMTQEISEQNPRPLEGRTKEN